MTDVDRTFVVFEVGRANVGDSRARQTASALMRDWNERLVGSGVRFIGSVGHTGNYIVEAQDGSDAGWVAEVIEATLQIRGAVFTAADVRRFAHITQDEVHSEVVAPGRRPTAGLVMDLNPAGGVPSRPPNSERVVFTDVAVPRVRGVWKLDVLREDQKALDRTRREGGWGSIATTMSLRSGGKWTARSMRTVNQLVRKLEALPSVA